MTCRDRRPRLSAENIFSNLDLSESKLAFYKGKPPLVCFPSFAFGKIHPFVALMNDRGVSDSAESDQRYARWISASLLKKA